MVRSPAIPALSARRPAISGPTRAAILEATVEVIARHSLSGTTVERVALAAGVAPGTVILHFKRKEALLIEVLEDLAQEFDQARRSAIAGAADDPAGALDRLIEINFDPKVSDPAKVAVWYAFWGEAAARSVYLERAGAIDDSYQDDLVRICTDLKARGGYDQVDAEAAAVGLIGTIDYLWQEIMVAGRRFDRARARRTARGYLANIFPRHFSANG
ncbi:MAG TPA: TetR family transcriptional regulator C-terminal domain-containing protein [Candidatus Acidoferrum sp.]|nr:TetR family transcriptional regulator C-terminal domain-containing protein [Candidatus Acidoferrum sp.]